MRRLLLAVLGLAAVGSLAAAPAAGPASDAPVGVSTADGTFPIGVCAWARPAGDDPICVVVNDPRPSR